MKITDEYLDSLVDAIREAPKSFDLDSLPKKTRRRILGGSNKTARRAARSALWVFALAYKRSKVGTLSATVKDVSRVNLF